MKYKIKTDTAQIPVSVAELKHYLRVVSDDVAQDTLIRSLIVAATKTIETEAHISVLDRVYTYFFNDFTSEELLITLKPASSVDAVRYYDGENELQTLGTSVYEADIIKYRAMVLLKSGQSFPATYPKNNAVEIDVTIGFGAIAVDVPEDLRLAIKMLAAHWFDNRGLIGDEKSIPMGIQRIISLNRNLGI